MFDKNKLWQARELSCKRPGKSSLIIARMQILVDRINRRLGGYRCDPDFNSDKLLQGIVGGETVLRSHNGFRVSKKTVRNHGIKYDAPAGERQQVWKEEPAPT